MITKNIKAYIDGNSIELSEQINVYSGDGDIDINMTLIGFSYELEQMYSDMKIIKPDGSDSITKRHLVVNDIVNFIITREMIDESIEVGEHKLQIRIWDSLEGGNRIALPPFIFAAKKELEGSVVILYALTDIDGYELLDSQGYNLVVRG